MNKRLLIFTILLIGFSVINPISINGQLNIDSGQSASYENGYKLATKLKGPPQMPESELSENLELWEIQPAKEKGNKFVKFIADRKNLVYFGYFLEFTPDAETKKIKVVIKPVKESGYKLPSSPTFDASKYTEKDLPAFPNEIIINDGDTIVLDLLESKVDKGKVQELIKITSREDIAGDYFAETEKSTDFSLNDVVMNLIDFEVFVNGKQIKTSPTHKFATQSISFRFKNKGSFIINPFPNEKYNLTKIGVITNNRIRFTHNNDTYEIVSKTNIFGRLGKWNLWGAFVPIKEDEKNSDSNQMEFFPTGYGRIDYFFDKSPKPKIRIIKLQNY